MTEPPVRSDGPDSAPATRSAQPAGPGPGGLRPGRGQGGGTTLRARLLLAFTVVTVTAIALVTAAAFVGSSRGLSAQQESDRRGLTRNAATAAADAYRRAGSWDGADLGPALAIATGGEAWLVVRDGTGQVVTTTSGHGNGPGKGNGPGRGPGNGNGPGNGMGMGNGMGTGMPHNGMGGPGPGQGSPLQAPVTVDGTGVGTVTLIFPASGSGAGRPVAWTWIGIAALAALALALVAAWLITRMLTRPLAALIATTRAFAAGDRDARTGLTAPGELGALATAFDEAAQTVQLAETARRRMSADVAHELRTPLAALQAGLEELRDGLVPADVATLARLHDQSLRLSRVVADLADLAAADATRLTLRPGPVDLTAVAAAAADAHEAPLRAAGLTLTRTLDGPVEVHGDAGRLHQVVANLLQNCARHCRPGDRVELSVRTVPAAGIARLTVADTGPGIHPGDLPEVFTRFWRSGDGSGSGLGMPIVKAIVEAHGGSVGVDSDGRTGTRVTVDLPTSPRR
ncbi:MAG TPA: HAMP domain-containing sensor histidine kinase [Kineosporiaceae bacterium]|nr:HAMP domain-containing sensor histidine kinase [Kineosporiaceae bacterium]